MLSGCLVMLFSRMEKILDSLTPWRNFTQMCLGGASTMAVSYRGCGKRRQLFPSIYFLPWLLYIKFLLFIAGP